jgi:hypothetical protein
MRTPHIKFVETLQIDFNLLIYNCGGIIGFWFGLNPILIADFIPNLWIKTNSLLIIFYAYILIGFNLFLSLLQSFKVLMFRLLNGFLIILYSLLLVFHSLILLI